MNEHPHIRVITSTRRWAATLFLVGLAFNGLARPATSADTRPNVLFIITDDQARSEFNFLPEGSDEQGNPRNLTPNIDRIAAEGVVFLNQYVSSPVCTPSTISILLLLVAAWAQSLLPQIRSRRETEPSLCWSYENTPPSGRGHGKPGCDVGVATNRMLPGNCTTLPTTAAKPKM